MDHGLYYSNDHEKTRGWFYYLAEIAIRHLLNRIVRGHRWTSDGSTDRRIRRLLAQSELLQTQLHDWYLSLPAILNFEIPTGYSAPLLTDDLTQILRQRYLSCQDLIARPFVKLCVESPLDINPELRHRVTSLASEGVRVLTVRLSQVTPYRHQGHWFLLRTVATASLILGAVHLASKLAFRTGAQDITTPVGWKEAASEALVLLRPYLDDGRADTCEMNRVVQSVLDACH